MHQHHVPVAIWSQNIACFIFMSIISLILFNQKLIIFQGNHRKFLLPACLILLMVTLVNQGMEGVHRWISIGFINFNIAMIVMPIIFIELWHVLNTKDFQFGWVFVLIVMLMLFLQPDASQLTGFSIPMMIMLCLKVNHKALKLFLIIVFAMFITLSWVFLDNLPPVAYVEGILTLAADVGFSWLILGVLSLAAFPMPFLVFPPKNREILSRCIGFYYMIIMLSTLFGNFPVPLMGYGLSPVMGIYISLIWYVRSRNAINVI